MSESAIRVVKVGGSLFERPDLAGRLRNWLTPPQGRHTVMIAGGGRLADQVRAWHSQQPLDDATAHWMCIDLLSVTSRLLQSWLPEITRVSDEAQLRVRAASPGATIFDPVHWLRHIEPGLPGAPLPENWETTSDAIAGRLSMAVGAEELVLLKWSAPPSIAAGDLRRLAEVGYIDSTLAKMAASLPSVRMVGFGNAP